MRGVPITIRCDCGDARPVHYGERWTCARCGKTWSTAQIPSDEYWGAMRELRRYRLLVWLATAVVVAVLVPLAVVVSPSFFVVVLLVLGAGYFFVLPRLRRRVLERMRDRPSWRLRPE
jgi:Flp pilus assembly protein TadB